jgi:hypothetical protein
MRRDTGLDDSKEINKLTLDRKIWIRETIAAHTFKPP